MAPVVPSPIRKLKAKSSRLIALCLDCLFPPVCLACRGALKNLRETTDMLCALCVNTLAVSSTINCPVCGKRVPFPAENQWPKTGDLCGVPYLLAAAASYESGVVRKLVHELKYNSIRSAMTPLRSLLIEPYVEKTLLPFLFSENCSPPTAHCSVVPIPLHQGKERRRGFNQAALIGTALVESLRARGITAETVPILSRVRKTKTQTEIKNREARAENVRGCFVLSTAPPSGASEISDVNRKNSFLILTDDVHTTGATMCEAARMLRREGFRRIIGFTVAKT